MPQVTLIPALDDNYIYLLTEGTNAAVVDPGAAAPVFEALQGRNLTLTHILCTHHHADHIGGVSELKKATGCKVLGPDDERIKGLDQTLDEGDPFTEGFLNFEVLSVPGHTVPHLAFYFPEEKWLFSGDTLFAGGCGRLFEGDAAMMWNSLSKLLPLPDETEIYCGHEYTVGNLRYAASIEPDSEAVRTRLAEAEALRAAGKPTIPSTLKVEKATNPFLRAEDPTLRKAMGVEAEAAASSVFRQIRTGKDNF